jgi:hypothetical protein
LVRLAEVLATQAVKAHQQPFVPDLAQIDKWRLRFVL